MDEIATKSDALDALKKEIGEIDIGNNRDEVLFLRFPNGDGGGEAHNA